MIPFRTYQSAVEIYRRLKTVCIASHLKDQATRAASSVALNLAEGYGKMTPRDRMRFFVIAYGSARELQAVCDLEPESMKSLANDIDRLVAGLYKLTRS